MLKKKNKRWVTIIAVILAALLALPFSSYLLSYQPAETSQAIYQTRRQGNGYYYFDADQATDLGFIYYPGGLVSPSAYASFAKRFLDTTTHRMFITQPLFNLAITSINQAATIITHHPEINHWFIGGHSLGGSSAAFFAIDHLEQMKGLFFFASYTTASADFSSTSLPVLSVTGSEDAILNQATYQASQLYLPLDTTYVNIIGANHGSFGDYGQQRGDGDATISVIDQHQTVITAMQNWLATILLEE